MVVEYTKAEVPGFVKGISVLSYLSAGLFAIFGVLFIVMAVFSFSNPDFLNSSVANLFPISAGWIFIILAIFILAFSILHFFVGRGLWKGKNWARFLMIIMSLSGLIGSSSYIFRGNYFSGIVYFVLSVLVGGYLLFNKDVKRAFSK